MPKESEKTVKKTVVKKTRRKSESQDSETTSQTSVPAKMAKASTPPAAAGITTVAAPPRSRPTEGDYYKRVVEYEEAESLQRDADQDVAIYERTCLQIKNHMKQICALKKRDTPEAKTEIEERRIAASLLFVTLKKMNRLEKFRTKHSRDTLHRTKLQVDSCHLQLQNLLYEIMHLRKEVNKCLEFKSSDEEIDLVPLEVFYKEAPASISRKEETLKNPHAQRLARLEWELEQRKQLAAQCQQALRRKDEVAADINKQTDYLENLLPQLQNLMKVMIPVQEQMGIRIDKIRQLHKRASLLPPPLYVLFVQVEAYMNALDKNLSVTVEGNDEEAMDVLNVDTKSGLDPEDSDSDLELEPAEDTGEGPARRRRKLSRVDRQQEQKKRLLMKHPLHVKIVIRLKGFDDYITLTFWYLMNLGVSTVQCQVNLANPVRGISAGDLLSPSHLLCELRPGDNGEDSPNAANNFQLNSACLEPFSHYVNELGHPYLWVQHLCGLSFLSQQQGTDSRSSDMTSPRPDVALSRSCVPDLIQAIRWRLKARVALGKQVQEFESGLVPLLPAQKQQLFPPRVNTTLTSWQPVVWADYSNLFSTQRLVRENCVTSSDMLYRAALARGSAKLIVLIAVKPDYPRSPPVFSLNLHWNGEHNSGNNDAIREMESEVNLHWPELVAERSWCWGLLSAQLYRLMMCLDVYLEAMGTRGSQPPEFPREKVFFTPVTGRSRRLPFKYVSMGGGRFTQRTTP